MGAESEGANVRVRHGLHVLVTEYTTAASTEDWLKATPNGNVNTSDNTTVLLVPAADDEELRQLEQLYDITVPVLILLCTISVMINVRILLSVYWVRRPVSPTLHISLSLAGADALASAILGLGLALNSLLRAPLEPCVALVIEAFREGCIIVTVAHLLALAANHYLGILRPLHYLSIMTHRKTALSIAVLWLLPVTFFFSYFLLVEGQGFQTSDCRHDFLRYSTFRVTFSSLFFAPLILMLFIYTHIFFIVRRHQEGRLRISGVTHRCNTYSTQQNQQMARNVKAIYTTLLILGSYVVGLMPAVLIFVLVCEDCAFPLPSTTRERRNMFFIYTIVNLLVILKTGVNPIIYAARMQEIKLSSNRLNEENFETGNPYTWWNDWSGGEQTNVREWASRVLSLPGASRGRRRRQRLQHRDVAAAALLLQRSRRLHDLQTPLPHAQRQRASVKQLPHNRRVTGVC